MHFNYLIPEQIVSMKADSEKEANERMKDRANGLQFEKMTDLNNQDEKFKFSVTLNLTDNIWTIKELHVRANDAAELEENITNAINKINMSINRS